MTPNRYQYHSRTLLSALTNGIMAKPVLQIVIAVYTNLFSSQSRLQSNRSGDWNDITTAITREIAVFNIAQNFMLEQHALVLLCSKI